MQDFYRVRAVLWVGYEWYVLAAYIDHPAIGKIVITSNMFQLHVLYV